MDDDSAEEQSEHRREPPESRPGAFRPPNGRHIRTPTTRPPIVLPPSPVDASTGNWKVEALVADDGTVPFGRFVDGLPDDKFGALDAAIERGLAVRGLDLARTEWLEPLGGGLHEFRVRHDATTGGKALPRAFVHVHGERVILLGGYDKGGDPKARRRARETTQARRLVGRARVAGTCNYDEVVAARRARLGPESQERRRELGHAYDMAMQVIAARDKRELTQAELASRCRIDQAEISRIERGDMRPAICTLQRIAAGLGAELRLVEAAPAARQSVAES